MNVFKHSFFYSLFFFLIGFSITANSQTKPTIKGAVKSSNSSVKSVFEAVKSQQTGPLKSRVSQLHKIQAEYLKKVGTGKVKPYQDLQKSLTANSQKIATAKRDYERYLVLPEGSDERAKAGLALQLLVNELRRFLEFAEHPSLASATVKLSDEQVKELGRIESSIRSVRETPADPNLRMSVVGPNQRATFLYLPVPISIKAPKGSNIYLRSVAGGVFENGMSMIAKEADENGLVNTAWISRGDGVANCRIEIIGQDILEDQWMTIKVVQPTPIELPIQ